MRQDLRTTTKANYEVTYDRYIRSGFGKRKIADLKYSDIVLFYNTLMKEKELHIGTIQYIQRMIRPALQMAVRDNVLRANPADGVIQLVKRTTRNTETGVRKALTLDEQRAFINFINDSPFYERWRPLMIVMLGTGVRVGELIALTWNDVDFENKTISVNKSLAYFAGRKNKSPSKWLLNNPKTAAGNRTIPMVDTVIDALLEEKARQKRDGMHCQTVVNGVSGFIFYNRFYEVYVPESIDREIIRMIENYNSTEELKSIRENRQPVLLPHFSCHSLRHTFCTRLCEADVHIKVIQSIMGHKDIHTTLDIYSEVTEWKKKTSIDEAFKNMKLF